MPPKPFSRAWGVERIERRSLAKARDIVAKSDYVADWIARNYPHLAIHRIPSTFDPRILDVPLDSPREPRSIAFVGNIDPRKGPASSRRSVGGHLGVQDELPRPA